LLSWSLAGNTIALTKLLPPNSLSQQSPGAITTTTIITRHRQPPPSSAKAASSTPLPQLVIAQACKNWSFNQAPTTPSRTHMQGTAVPQPRSLRGFIVVVVVAVIVTAVTTIFPPPLL